MTAEMHALLGPYALDALDLTERARFEAHLEQCLLCQSELASFRASAARLGNVDPAPHHSK